MRALIEHQSCTGAARKREGDGEALRECSFVPRTGRAPAHGARGLPAPERLLHQHASKAQQARP